MNDVEKNSNGKYSSGHALAEFVIRLRNVQYGIHGYEIFPLQTILLMLHIPQYCRLRERECNMRNKILKKEI